jgi:hypothetical protein
LERVRLAAGAASDASGDGGIAMNIWWMRRMSNIQLILGDTTAGTKPTGRALSKAIGSIAL